MVPKREVSPLSDRQMQAEVRKKLIAFGYEEFNAKKPLDLKVIQLKPQTTFQKGSVFPELTIKTLKRTHFVVYCDFGDEIRFYFYDQEGRSLGGSNFPKTEKLLNEMHGKGSTLLHLPKKGPLDGLDTDSMENSTLFQKLAQRWAQKLNCPLPDLPPLVVKKYQSVKMTIRMGIHQTDQAFNLDHAFLSKKMTEVILLRELFVLFVKGDSKNEILQWLATLWASTILSPNQCQNYFS